MILFSFMIYEEMPEDFNSKFEVVSCFVEHDGKILLLHRQDHKPQGDTWCRPAGKVDEGEDVCEAIKRETMEETGIVLKNPKHCHKLFIRFPDYDFIFHVFHEVLEDLPDVVLSNEEHKDFSWKTIDDALKMNLMIREDGVIKIFAGYDEAL